MRRLLASANGVLRREGFGRLLLASIRKAFGPIIRVERWYFFESLLGDAVAEPPPARLPVEVRLARPEDFETHGEDFRRVQLDPSKVERRLARGDVAMLGLVEGRLAHVQWLAFSSPIDIEEAGVRLFLAPGEVYGYGTETLPEWRGRGIHPVVSSRVNEVARARGLVRHVAYVAAANAASLRAIARINHRWTKTVWKIRLLGTKQFVLGATREGRPHLTPLS